MQRIATLGLILDLASDLAAFMSDASGTVFTASLALGAAPALAAMCQYIRHAITDGTDAEIAAFRVETIRR
jgi:H+/Cl- antiporter ClcA